MHTSAFSSVCRIALGSSMPPPREDASYETKWMPISSCLGTPRMRLSELFRGVAVREPLPAIEIATISLGTEEIPSDCLYVKHPKCPEHLASASRAIANGAVAVVLDESDAESSALLSSSVPVFRLARADPAYAVMAA